VNVLRDYGLTRHAFGRRYGLTPLEVKKLEVRGVVETRDGRTIVAPPDAAPSPVATAEPAGQREGDAHTATVQRRNSNALDRLSAAHETQRAERLAARELRKGR
jgi:hypothetical protein